MAERRAALAGIRVIDLSHQAAGPRRAGGGQGLQAHVRLGTFCQPARKRRF